MKNIIDTLNIAIKNVIKNKNISFDNFFINYNVIECDVRDTELSGIFKNKNKNKYLGLIAEGNKKKIDFNDGELFYEYSDVLQIKNNNAEVLVLSGSSSAQLFDFNKYAHVKIVLFKFEFLKLSSYVALIGVFKNLLLNNVEIFGRVNIIEQDRCIKKIVLHVLKRNKSLRRRYISPIIGIEKFFKKINAVESRYAILRWFDDIPNIDKDEDIDILVDDRHIKNITSIIDESPGVIPCDLYSVSGNTGSKLKMSYYPPRLAMKILQNTELVNEHYYVPNKYYHFLSLLYHIIYHKGIRSGLISEIDKDKSGEMPEHDYHNIILSMVNDLKIDVKITMEGIDEYLHSVGWRPSNDMLRRISFKNSWVKKRFFNNHIRNVHNGEIAVFIIRQSAVENRMVDEISEMLKLEGFSMLLVKKIVENKDKVKNNIRGGNWGQSTWPSSGGDPAVFVVVYDLLPVKPSNEELRINPNLSNKRLLRKVFIRDYINSMLSAEKHSNMMHSSDNSEEAWEYIQLISSDCEKEIKKKIVKIENEFKTNFEVVDIKTNNGRRAKIEVIKYGEGLAVKKTFKPESNNFFKNELFVLKSFLNKKREIPKLLEDGSNYFIIPYYENVLKMYGQNKKIKLSHFMSIKIAKQAIGVLKFFYDNGYFLYDAHPTNLIVDKKQGLKFIDFEFVQKYKNKPSSFYQSYDIVGSDINILKSYEKRKRSYNYSWKPVIGVDIDDLVNNRVQLLKMKQFLFIVNFFFVGKIKNVKNKNIEILSYMLKRINRLLIHVLSSSKFFK